MSKLATFDSRPWLILCEGEGDKRFFHQLIEVRALPNEFQVRFPGRSADDKSGGRSKFGPWLMTSTAVSGWSSIQAVVIVSDNDDDRQKSFDEVRDSLATAGWPGIPNHEDTIAKADGYPHTLIHMVPENRLGGLEDLCLTASYSKWQNIQAPVETFAQTAGVGAWGVTKQSKMKLQSLIAATCKPRPETGFVGHWREDADYHVPVDHTVFDDLADFLGRIPYLAATA